jgi:5,10-methylenetetrahydrofolate reductase
MSKMSKIQTLKCFKKKSQKIEDSNKNLEKIVLITETRTCHELIRNKVHLYLLTLHLNSCNTEEILQLVLH